MREMLHFEEELEGWRWVRTDLVSGLVSRSTELFPSRSACMVDALGRGATMTRKPFGPTRNTTLH